MLRSSVVEHSIGNGEVDSSILSGSTSPFAGDPHNALNWNLVPRAAAPGYAFASKQAASCRLPQWRPLHARNSRAIDGWRTCRPRPLPPRRRMQTYCRSISTKSGARQGSGFRSVGMDASSGNISPRYSLLPGHGV